MRDIDISVISPIEYRSPYYFKRDDLSVNVGGAIGGKVRTCLALAVGAKGLVTAASRKSPQINIVAQVAKAMDLPARGHTASGLAVNEQFMVPKPIRPLAPELIEAQRAGLEVVEHFPGWTHVITRRAKDDALESGYKYIPFGMECKEAVIHTSRQAIDLPGEIKRIVVPVGSGMSLSGLLHGLQKQKLKIPVLGIMVGADPIPRLDKYAPAFWWNMVELIRSPAAYNDIGDTLELCGVPLDATYESKCVPYLKPNDLFWIIGRAASPVVDNPAHTLTSKADSAYAHN